MRPWEAHYPPGVGAQPPELPTDLTTAWRERVERDPDSLALLHDGQRLTAAELDARADAFATLLASRGIGPGDRVGILLQNLPTAVVVLLGAWRRGAVVPLLNPMYHGAELRLLLETSGARAIVVDPELREVAEKAAEGTAVEVVWADGDPELTAYLGEPVKPVPRTVEDVALLTFTSGTTGPPKAAMNTHGNVLTVAASVRDWMGLTASDRVLCVAPVFHITGAVITLTAPLLAGAAVVLVGRATPEGVLRAFRQDGVTTTTGSITVFNGLARIEGVGPEDFASVRHLYSGGAPVPPSTVERFRRDFGQYIHNIYGMTETTSACIGVPPGAQAPVDAATGALAIGLPFPGLDVRVVDPDGHDVPPGQAGELELSGPYVVPGYWENPQATAQTFPGGALRTGDGALVDEAGWVYIVDRLKDQINTSGYKVWPTEVEEVLLHHPQVHEAAVVGAPDDYRGEAVVAFVTRVAGGTVTEKELRAHARAELAAYKVPRRVEFLDELPKTPSGKIRRRALRDGLTQEDAQV